MDRGHDQPNGTVASSTPSYLLRNNDGAYGDVFTRRLRAMSIRDRPVTPRSPWQNGYVERVIGSIRRECLDHVIVWNASHFHHVLNAYLDYYNLTRTHLALGKDAQFHRPVQRHGSIHSHRHPWRSTPSVLRI